MKGLKDCLLKGIGCRVLIYELVRAVDVYREIFVLPKRGVTQVFFIFLILWRFSKSADNTSFSFCSCSISVSSLIFCSTFRIFPSIVASKVPRSRGLVASVGSAPSFTTMTRFSHWAHHKFPLFSLKRGCGARGAAAFCEGGSPAEEVCHVFEVL